MKRKKRIAVVGAGTLARIRGRALLETGRSEICGVASRRLQSARRYAQEFGLAHYFDDYRRLGELSPDAILIEVPHSVQYKITTWALQSGIDLLIGGVLCTTPRQAEEIGRISGRKKLIVEAGYDARYNPAWQALRDTVRSGRIGRPIMARSLALWGGDPSTWYYDQQASGGMPLTHMTYCFINLLRWVLGRVVCVQATANRILHRGPKLVREENCTAILTFASGAFASVTGGYVKPSKTFPSWNAEIVCTQGVASISPADLSGSSGLCIYGAGATEKLSDFAGPSPFVRQADAFLEALDSRKPCLNPPSDAAADVAIADAISRSARTGRKIRL